MTRNKGSGSAAARSSLECCMCGDCGFSHELFQCKVCQFRSQHRNRGSGDDESKNRKIKNENLAEIHGGKKGQRGIDGLGVQFNKPIKKQRSGPTPTSPSVLGSARKRIVTNSSIEDNLRRTKSEEISNRPGIKKQVFRNKVRKYKLLDEVSS
ncbi:Ubiquitin carboxyl-terminal hydrolase [Quillaja saponaria]|uniref:Ubiquitin carboxyl-terminal hydrolase n=1 Tax=Quillaja saponaria TaxID=32244 RepID=A0AAD7LWW1_QUISA|nr:Ubiquitin carboxyl-terminal hydrolase [Quillaja saponaria]